MFGQKLYTGKDIRMMYKWVGSVLVFAGCGGFGLSLAGSHIRKERMLMQIVGMLDEMECELRYRLTKLPQLCMMASRNCSGPVRRVMTQFSRELERRISPDPASCMERILDEYPVPDDDVRYLLAELGRSLGRFDLEGQLMGIDHVKQLCDHHLQMERSGVKERMLCYRDLGFCAGAALVILLV